ncbi:MAG: TIGR04053 family radical SAM/SPASM domain-containing protein [Bryobacterales bacterium]|nr:TIGR04053 family radical SAM/SPASM domain-containing protein [Bryobacterales bacterium]
MRFDDAPFLVIWEVTQACALACAHCRADARPCRDPGELSTSEGALLLREVRRFGDPLMVFTGGDPLERPDLFRLLRLSVELGLRTTVTPSATPLLTRAAVERFSENGVARMAISVDDDDAKRHDGFRGVAGSFRRSLEALEWAREVGLETQVNTTVTRRNQGRLEEIAKRVEATGAKLWSVFFLVATGRAQRADDLTAEEYEQAFARLYALSRRAPFDVKTTEAQHYRRFVAQQRKREGAERAASPRQDRIARHGAINDGKGLVFISHTGEIYPSGFLPLSAGNVRRDSLADVYRSSPLFRALRRPDDFSGKCGACEFRRLCGGSRSRAYALTGDPLASDPRCAYRPAAYPAALLEEASA